MRLDLSRRIALLFGGTCLGLVLLSVHALAQCHAEVGIAIDSWVGDVIGHRRGSRSCLRYTRLAATISLQRAGFEVVENRQGIEDQYVFLARWRGRLVQVTVSAIGGILQSID